MSSQNTTASGTFDFDAWQELAKSQPELFEISRREVIDLFILESNKKHQLQLQRLQFRIEGERARARTPMKACLRISELMWDSFLELRERLNAIHQRTYEARRVYFCQSDIPGSAAVIQVDFQKHKLNRR